MTSHFLQRKNLTMCAQKFYFSINFFSFFEDFSGFSADVGWMHTVFFGEFFAGNMLKEVHTDEFGIVRVE